ncbi:MAG: hypothetical protein ABI134_07275, partial [Byssovorax sp.]
MITRSELLDVVYRFYPRGVLPSTRRLHKGEGGAEHPLLFLWLCAESGKAWQSVRSCEAVSTNPPR